MEPRGLVTHAVLGSNIQCSNMKRCSLTCVVPLVSSQLSKASSTAQGLDFFVHIRATYPNIHPHMASPITGRMSPRSSLHALTFCVALTACIFSREALGLGAKQLSEAAARVRNPHARLSVCDCFPARSPYLVLLVACGMQRQQSLGSYTLHVRADDSSCQIFQPHDTE